MRRITYILVLLLFCYTGYGQIKRCDLYGEWQTKNDDSLYYQADTIRLYKDINHFYNTKTCHLIWWTIDKKTFKISNIFTCTEPGKVSAFRDKEKLRLRNTDFGQVIALERKNQLFDKFKVTGYKEKHVDRYPHKIKELRVIRFDELSDYKLYKYVDSLIFKVLDYDSTFKYVSRNINTGNTKIVEVHITNPEPLIILNGHVITNREILKYFLLVETKGISYLTKEESVSIYGDKALNGVIVLLASEKRFQKVWSN